VGAASYFKIMWQCCIVRTDQTSIDLRDAIKNRLGSGVDIFVVLTRGAAFKIADGADRETCACRKSNPNIFVVQSAEDWSAPSAPALHRDLQSDHPLGARVDMGLLDDDRLAIPPPVSVDGFNQFVWSLTSLTAKVSPICHGSCSPCCTPPLIRDFIVW
jgi:hypothetical protein